MRLLTTLCVSLLTFGLHDSFGQTNISFSNPTADSIFKGLYNPATYASTAASDPHIIASELTAQISPDSLKSYLFDLSGFETRHSASDTVSATRGIGAARRWAFQKFTSFSAQNGKRLQVSYLNFTRSICGVLDHKNILAVLPGKDHTADPIIIEGHIDSRCAGACDTACVAEGMEDNASGSALVLELARVMSKYQFDRTILFMLTIGEEQGLFGADAMADYCLQNQISPVAVLNNDVIGGIICGETSSAPSCPGLNDIDSTQVRIFSAGGFTSNHKQLARYIKLQYHEELVEHVKVPQLITIMTNEDRIGRGGDHIPFREKGFRAVRFTSANEHGDASNDQDYTDRQHTSEDILGVDTDNDGQIDSFFVDFNYLARNAAINANAAVMIAQNVCEDLEIEVEQINWHQLQVSITDFCAGTSTYRIAMRSETNDWDTVYATNQLVSVVEVEPGKTHFVSAARVNDQGIESLFSSEQYQIVVGINEVSENRGIELLQNRPNPFDESTIISFIVHDSPENLKAEIEILSVDGKLIEAIPVAVKQGVNEVAYNHGFGKTGTFHYRLVINGEAIATKKMIFYAN